MAASSIIPDVASMLARAAPPWLVAVAIAVGAAMLFLAYTLLERALRIVWQAMWDRLGTIGRG